MRPIETYDSKGDYSIFILLLWFAVMSTLLFVINRLKHASLMMTEAVTCQFRTMPQIMTDNLVH